MAEYYDYITGQGVIVPDTSTVLSEIQELFRTTFGQDIDLTATTPQGRLVEMFQRNRTFCIQICALVSNMLNLNRATGFVLDDLGSLFLLERHPATHTTTMVSMTGVNGTIVPAGTRLQTEDGDIFQTTQRYIIGEGSTVMAESLEYGAVPCPTGTLTVILDRINGLETVTNGVPVLGSDLESDTEFRARIKESLNINSIAILSAIKSNLLAVDGVKDSYCFDNYESNAVTVDGVSVPGHSILACVEGGTDLDVAKVLYAKKTIGTGYIDIFVTGADSHTYKLTGRDDVGLIWTYNSTVYYTAGHSIDVGDVIYSNSSRTTSETTVTAISTTDGITPVIQTVIDEAYGSVYVVRFLRPITQPIDVEITVSRQGYSGADLSEAVKDAVMKWYNGEVDGVDGIKIGKAVSPFEISAAVSDVLPDIFVSSVKVGEHGSTLLPETMDFGAIHKATLERTNITVTVI